MSCRKVGEREDVHVAQLIRRVHDEEQALAPVVVMHDRITKGLRNLVPKSFVGGVVATHTPSFAQLPVSRGPRHAAHVG